MNEEKNSGSFLEKPENETKYVPVQYVDSEEEEDSIDLIELAILLWKSKKTIILFTLGFFFLGIFHISTEPEEYVSEAILLKDEPELTGNQLRLVQQLGAFGQGSGSLGGGISASLDEVVESLGFQMRLLHEEVRFAGYDTTLTLYDFFDQYYERPFRGSVYGFIRNYTVLLPITIYQKFSNLLRRVGGFFRRSADVTVMDSDESLEESKAVHRYLEMSPHTINILGQIGGRMKTETDGSLIIVTFRLPDPIAAAEANAIFVERIQEYLIEQRIEKANRNLQYALVLSEEAQERFETASLNVARFVDANPGNLTALATVELDRLIAERDRLSSVLANALVKVEDARMRVQEETPVFILFQEPLLPNNRVALSPLFLLGFLFLGFTLGMMWVITVKIASTIKNRLEVSER